MPLGTEVGLGPGDIVLDGDPALPTERVQQPPPLRPVFIVAKRSHVSATAELLLASSPVQVRSIAMIVSVYACLSARIYQKRHVRAARNFIYVSHGAMARSFSVDSDIRYILPVLRMTLCFHIMG